MLKQASATTLIALTLVAPLATFAKETTHKNNGQRGRVEHKTELKHRVDVNVSLNGKVTVMTGNMLTMVANNGSTYTIDTSAAKFIRRYGAAMGLGDIQVNDQLFVTGSLLGSVVKAKVVQDLSLQAKNGDFTGTIKSLSSTSLVLASNNRGDQTITIASTTKIMKGNMVAALSDLVVGQSLHVDGVWDRANSNVTATKIQIIVKNMEVHLNGTVSALANVSSSTTAASSLTLAATDGKSYQVNLEKAQLITRSSFGRDFSQVRVGDTVQVGGKTETASANVKAQLVVDFSL